MRNKNTSLPPGQPDPALQRKLFFVQQGCLAVVAIIAIVVCAALLFPSVAYYLPSLVTHMSIPMALTALLCTYSLVLSQPESHFSLPRFSRYVAVFAGLLAVAILIEDAFRLFPGLDALLDKDRTASNFGGLPLQLPATLSCIAVAMILVSSGGAFVKRVADVFVSGLSLLTLVLITENTFGALGLFGLSTNDLIPSISLTCLVLLTAVVALRQAENGVFSIFLGQGIGSRIARGFAPILLVIPFLGDVVRTHIAVPNLVPAQYGNAILTSAIAASSILLLLFLVWRINTMEKEIHDLTLRDHLTGLYNMRGFYLLAEQTLRLAQRAQLPFSVLFIDLDGLKQINDKLGHNAGSAYLAETGELVDETFREGDVKGRFGGDEFVVAGQFSKVGIEIATQRLITSAAERTAKSRREFPLSLSIGHVTAEYHSTETLKELVTKADEAMYKEKRRKKMERK